MIGKNTSIDSSLDEINKLRVALDNVPAHVYIKDVNSHYIYANKITMELFGCDTESELIGKADSDFFPRETVKKLRKIDLQVFQGKQSQQEIATKDLEGNDKVYWEVKTPLYNNDNSIVIGLLGISSDITELKRLSEENQTLLQELANESHKTIIGAEFGLADTINLANRAAQFNSPVLLLGETGTGKDVIASHIHTVSARNRAPFIRVNCGAIPDSLMDSELFGHEKGAFTGASGLKRGKFERANGGTIFLDEIGELPLAAQVRLLRVLQNNEFERVGGMETLNVNIRVIAATHRDIKKMVEQGTFREDLYFRLSVFPIHVPALRERKQDIPALIDFFINRKSQLLKLGKPPKLTSHLVATLCEYAWPGNVRELENVIERALITNEGPILSIPVLDEKIPTADNNSQTSDNARCITSLDEAIKIHIQTALDICGGQIHGKNGAAALLEINPNTLRSKMRKLGIGFSLGTD